MKNNRMGFIGGTDATRIMKGNWHDLWLEKTGQKEPEDLSNVIAVQIGIATEEYNLSLVEKEYEVTFWKQEEFSLANVNGNVPYIGTVDGYYEGIPKIDQSFIVECKHTYENNTIRNQLNNYMPQLQFYMFIANVDFCYFSNLFGNRKWDCVKVQRDDNYIISMNKTIKIFWDCVINKEAPTDQVIDTPCIDKILIDDMIARDATTDNEFISLAHDYIDSIASAKTNERAKKDLKSMVAANEREVYSDILSITRDKRGALRFNVK